MIKSVTATNYLGESIKMELTNPYETGLLIEKIDGLGPPNASINATEFGSGDGSLYNSSRISSRNIVISLIHLWNPTIEDSRQLVYKYFPLKLPVILKIETGNRTCEALGYTESDEVNIFSNNEKSQVSIVCPDPYLYDVSEGEYKSIKFYGVNSTFIFPFSNNSLTNNELIFGENQKRSRNNLYYTGDVEIGVTIKIHFTGEARNIILYDLTTRETLFLNTEKLKNIVGSNFQLGDDVVISTIRGHKGITLIRGGLIYNIINIINKNDSWFQLRKGDNLFAHTAEYGFENVNVDIQYRPAFLGV